MWMLIFMEEVLVGEVTGAGEVLTGVMDGAGTLGIILIGVMVGILGTTLIGVMVLGTILIGAGILDGEAIIPITGIICITEVREILTVQIMDTALEQCRLMPVELQDKIGLMR